MRRLVSFLLAITIATAARADSKPLNRPGLPLRPEPVEIQLIDGSKLFLTLGDDAIDVTTPYGKLRIRLAEITRIEFGMRPPSAVRSRIETAVALLASGDEKRTDAWLALAAAKEFAYPTLVKLTKHSERSISIKAGQMLDVLRKAYPAERLRRIDHDVIHTDASKIVGRIELADLRTITPHFGPMRLRLNDLASLAQGEEDESDEMPVNVQPDPGYLSNFQQHVGQSFYFRVTGAVAGTVWGSDIYTTDSALASAAVHAGAVKMGQTGIVKVTILAGQNGYTGSTRNGISTSGYGPYPGSYKVTKVGQKKRDDD
jgi:hypothetical protein